jgi:hypothetical protein
MGDTHVSHEAVIPLVAARIAVAAVLGTSAATLEVIPVDTPPSLRAYQSKCTHLMAAFVSNIHLIGPYRVVMEEAYRPRETALYYAARKLGISNSLHTQKLAFDFSLDIRGTYQDTTIAHQPLGLMWEEMGRYAGIPTAWGGRFGDGNHYSCSYRGVK